MPEQHEPTGGDFEVSPAGTGVMSRTSDGLSLVGSVSLNQKEHAANARLFAASKRMLAACVKAERRIKQSVVTFRMMLGRDDSELVDLLLELQAAIRQAREGT